MVSGQRPDRRAALARRHQTSIRNPPRWAALAVSCVAQLMVVLDVSIVNMAPPGMKQRFGLSQTGDQWVVNACTLTFAALLVLWGRAADLFGRRRVAPGEWSEGSSYARMLSARLCSSVSDPECLLVPMT